ncbi:MAG: PqiC family protein [Chromatocurvus sp.]
MTPAHRLAAAGLLLALVACTTPTVVNYLTLTTTPQGVVRKDAAPIGIGPITLPDYLKRNGLARRDSEGALHYSTTELWAEPLDSGIQRTLIETLSDALGDTPVLAFPGLSSIKPQYQITVSVRRLTARPAAVEMSATWRIIPIAASTADPVRTGQFRGDRTLTSPSGTAIARALSELVNALALDVANAIPAQSG